MSVDQQIVVAVRTAILTSIPQIPVQYNEVKPQHVFLPRSHLKALDPNTLVVSGNRGAGKSFWWWWLLDFGGMLRNYGFTDKDIYVGPGFGEKSDERWPGKDKLAGLLNAGHNPRIIWKAVFLRNYVNPGLPADWDESVKWVASNPTPVAESLRRWDDHLVGRGYIQVVLFDALDRTADTREARQQLLRGLLELALELRSYRALRAKIFVRPDMLDDPAVTDFVDSSKVLQARADLTWGRPDLYGLFFKYLGNSDDTGSSEIFREMTNYPWMQKQQAWELPTQLVNGSDQQRIFQQIAGPYMGSNSRKGDTYRWIYNHLADARGSVSPRCFLAALRRAAESAVEKNSSDDNHPLHWKDLVEGVRTASQIRFSEIKEDFPFAHQAMDRLRDLVVPCTGKSFIDRWVNVALKDKQDSIKPEEVLRRLENAGIIAKLSDDKFNVPDVYRAAFGIRRKGGFRPQDAV